MVSACLPAMFLPFQNLSPHPELQEQRATALWKIATGVALEIVVTPIAATAILQRNAESMSIWPGALRRGESFDLENLLGHLNTVGYASATWRSKCPDNMPTAVGFSNIYWPEAERPVRIEFFGDEVDSIRRFDPASQRSSKPIG